MRQRSVKTRAGSMTAAAVLAVVGLGQAAQAGFTIDLRLAGGGKASTVASGAVVNLQVFGQVTGSAAGAEGLQDAFFGVQNTGGAGNLSVVTLSAPFTGVATDVTPNVTTSSSGSLYGAAGSLSVGSTNSASADGWVFARATSMQTAVNAGGSAITNGLEFLLGTLTFTAGSTPGTATLHVNPRAAANSLVVPAVWQMDGVSQDAAATPGSDVTITIPSIVNHINGDTSPYDNVVDLNDLNNVLNNFGTTNAVGYAWPRTQGNAGGPVDLNDLNGVLNNFGSHAAAAGLAVPEPASMSLIGLGAAALVARRRR